MNRAAESKHSLIGVTLTVTLTGPLVACLPHKQSYKFSPKEVEKMLLFLKFRKSKIMG